MNLDLQHKTALVCGSTQGIGKAAAMELSKLGANIILLARDEAKLKSTLSELDTSRGQKHSYLSADFGQTTELEKKLADFLKDKPVEILINNTGGPAAGPVNTATLEEFRMAFNMHLICNHILVTAVKDKMIAAKYGRIINVISTSVKQPLPNLGVSNTIRGAVANWSKTLANELGQFGITVNNVLPGATATGRLKAIIEGKAAKTGVSPDEAGKEMMSEIPLGRFA